jgi:hypothetical protein
MTNEQTEAKTVTANTWAGAPRRLRGTLRIVQGKGYGFVIDAGGYEHYLHGRKVASGEFKDGTVIEFTPGDRLSPNKPAPCVDVVVLTPE